MTAPTQAPPQAGRQGQKPPQIKRPFVAGTRRVDRQTYDQTKTLTSSTQTLPTYEIDPNGFLSGLYVLVEATTSGNSANVAYSANGPFNVIDTIQLSDTNSKPIVGPFSGWDLYQCVKLGGYSFSDDAKQSPIYSATTGTGGTGGSFAFVLRLPIEIARRDALGTLPNKSSSATYSLDVTLAASATVYSTTPTSAASVRVRYQDFGWMDPNTSDAQGNPVSQVPPGLGTIQYWQKQSYTLPAGSVYQRLQSLDSLIRNFIFYLQDSNSSRTQGDSDWPDPFILAYETSQPVNRLRTVWRHMIGERYGYNGTTPDVGGARDYGVYPESYCHDFTHKPGFETRLGYLPVSSNTKVEVSGSIGGSGVHTLYVLVNKVVPAGGNPLVLTGR